MKKFLSIMLSILMVVTMLPMAVMPASAAENLDYNIKLEVVDWAVYETSGKLIGEFNAVEHGDAFYDVSLTQADDGTFTCSYQIALERNDGNTAWGESSISFKIDSCEDEFMQEFEKSFYSNYNIFYNLKVTRSAGHSFSDWADAGDGTHTRICSVCSKTETQNHSFDGGNCLTVGKCVCGLSSIDSNVHTKPVKYVVNSENDFKHDEVYECCGVIKSNLDHKYDSKGMCKECKYQCAHSSFTDSICDFCGYNSAFVVIDGTLGGKTTATEDDVNTLVEQLKGYVDSGITTIIVTGSEPALYNFYGIDTSAVSAALYYLADGRSDSPYCGTIDLILPDVTEIVDDEFNSTFALNSITLPKVTTVGDGAFYGTTFLQTLTFGSVITFVSEKNSGPFHMDGYKVGGCDLVLNCGQLQAEDKYKPNFETNVWFIGDWSGEYEWKSITLTHTGGEATCVAKAVCETCGEEYGDIDANAHSYSDVHSNGNGTHSFTCTACHITGIENHTGGEATCKEQAKCEHCGASYGELDPDNHASDTYTYTDNGDGTHSAVYPCCGAAVAEVPHTLDITTGKCSACGADMTVIATVTDSTNTYYAADAATLNQAVTAILETGSRTFTVELPADTEAEMITAIRRAICDTDGVADGSINLTLKGVTSIPGTTNWDGVAFGPRNAQWDENNVEIVSHEEVTQLASVNLPDATEIGAQAFYWCENLASVSAPKAQTIGAQAFGYTALTSVEFPELTTIPTDMFSGTWTLSSAKFPKVTTIEQNGLLIGAKFNPENNPTPFPLELTAEGDITFNGTYHFNIASQNYSGKVDLVLNIDKKEQVTFNDDGTATWQVRDDLSYTFKSITFTCTDGTTNHSYTYTDNGDGTHDMVCTGCGHVKVDNEAHTIENHVCTACGAMEIVVSFDAGDYEWKTGDTLYFCRVSGDNEWEEYAFTATVAGDGTVTWTPDKTLYWDDTGKHKLVVVYPGDTPWAWDRFYVGDDQTTTEKLHEFDLMNAMWSGNPTTDPITLNLKHRLAKVTVNYEIAEGVTVSKAEVYTLTQYLLFDIHTLERKNIAWEEGHDLWINSYHNGNQFTAFVSPDAYAADGNFIKITLSDGTVYEVKMNKAVTFEEGAEYSYKVVITADGTYLTCADKCTFEYTDNGDGTHDMVCTGCGHVEVDNEAHSGGTATCTEQAECRHCGASYGEVNTHDWSNLDGVCANGCGAECPHDSYTDGVCDSCKYECTHEWDEGVLTRPTFETAGYYTYTCTLCGHSYTEPTKKADDTALNDASMKVMECIGNSTLTQEALNEIHNSYLDILKNNGNIFDEFGFVRGDLVEEDQPAINAVTAELEKIVADAEEKIASGEYVKADYTEIDEAIASVDEALKNATISDEMSAELEDIKADLEDLKENEGATMADVNELLERAETVAEKINNCAKGVHSFTKYEEVTAPECGKAGLEKAVCDHGCGATDEKEIPALTHEPLEAVKENEVAPKCGVAGSYDLVVYCDLCGEELDRDTITVDALTHKDDDGDYLCDHGCGHEFPKPDTPDTPDEPTDEACDHLCHKDGILGFLWKIIRFFYRLFNIQQYCDCGILHYDTPLFG